MEYLKEKTLLVTGASGIAGATIRLATEAGARVYYAALEEASCLQLQDTLSARAETAFRVCDLRIPEEAGALVRSCVERFGCVDAVFNVAGTSGRKFGDGPLEACTEAGWTATLEANLHIQYRMCREAVKRMKENTRGAYGQKGTILNMASVLGVYPEPEHFAALAYGTSKGAIIAMTRHIAAYYAGEGIRVNAIAPGLAATAMSARATSDADILSFIETRQPLTRGLIAPGDIAEVALFLLGDGSRVITGQTILADGGWNVR